MSRKIFLETRSEPASFTLVGISCHLPDYRLIFSLNKLLEFDFTRENDFKPASLNLEVEEGYAFYLYCDEDQRLTYYLISNRNQGNLLLPAMKQLDFILVIEGELNKTSKEKLLSTFKAIPNVIIAFEIRFSELKNHESFLTDIEFHILGINRGSKQPTTRFKPM